MNKISKYISAVPAIFAILICFASCDDVDYPDRYKVADGAPTVYSVRYADQDINITQAYMDEIVCILGDNLRSTVQLWFNDQEATLNTSYITDNTLMVSVPKNMPKNQTDKMYLITRDQDTVAFDFKVLPPVPKVSSMSNEWAKEGEKVTIYGSYLIDDSTVPLEISFPGATVSHSDMTFDGSSSVSFHVPSGAQSGYVTVTSLSGTGKSKFVYKDSRNILFDWDGSHGGFATGHGWRNGVVHTPGTDSFTALDGSYLYFGGAEMKGGIGDTWAEDNFSFDYWPDAVGGACPPLSSLPTFADYIKTYDVGGLQIKFEVLVPSASPWSAAGLQIMFSSDELVTYATATNGYFSNAAFPRAVWMPWTSTGSYDTADKWVTVTIPFTSFNKSFDNAECATAFSKKYLTGLTFFVWNGGIEGTTCNPVLAIDNIRVVPTE